MLILTGLSANKVTICQIQVINWATTLWGFKCLLGKISVISKGQGKNCVLKLKVRYAIVLWLLFVTEEVSFCYCLSLRRSVSVTVCHWGDQFLFVTEEISFCLSLRRSVSVTVCHWGDQFLFVTEEISFCYCLSLRRSVSVTALFLLQTDLTELKPYDARLMMPVNKDPVSLVLEGSNVGRGNVW